MATNTLRRVLETVGLRRRARDITPHPLEYAEQFDRRKREDIDDLEAEEASA